MDNTTQAGEPMNDEQNKVPPPGSKEAIALGCKCAVVDNHYGRGIGEINGRMMYVISGGCPLHDINSILAGFLEAIGDDEQ